MKTEKQKQGFTVMEIFIVILILGIIAAIVVPKFSQASSESRLEELVSDLQMVRSQIELYKIQHKDLLPGQFAQGGSVDEHNFKVALTVKGSDGMGPYLKKLPKNYYVPNAKRRDSITFVNDPKANPTGKEGTGWWFNAATGDFRANDSLFHAAY
ncbi:MAG: type II secretion system protein [Sedimentisphaerales bacterium]|nr:type II secretion system protein [Sedimentisphaerales bacterium]